MTSIQSEILQTYINTGSYSETARVLGKDKSYVHRTIKLLEAKGQVPWQSSAPIPAHLKVGKTTVQYDSKGRVIQEWRRQFPKLELLKEEASCKLSNNGLYDDVVRDDPDLTIGAILETTSCSKV